ncbi:MAG: shikimate dehydrogenase [Betaproteobacteria bacterium]|nr:shikimate dehydrogenase [Betaproteobacteria bacterium]
MTLESVPDHYAVIGNPIEHSKSPQVHALFAQQTQQAMHYERLLAPVDHFADSVHEFIAQGGRGANVTVPFKLEAFALAQELTPRAKAAGAVNTLSFSADGIKGDNTDGIGLVRDIARNAGTPLRDRSVLLLGAGGAARGVILPLIEEGIACLVVANRTQPRAMALAKQFSDGDIPVSSAAFDQLDQCFDVIINATSASLDAELPPLPDCVFGPQTLAYDMMYGAQPTIFMQHAAQRGAVARDGLGMLIEQAAESFFVWRGVRPETAPVYQWLRDQL